MGQVSQNCRNLFVNKKSEIESVDKVNFIGIKEIIFVFVASCVWIYKFWCAKLWAYSFVSSVWLHDWKLSSMITIWPMQLCQAEFQSLVHYGHMWDSQCACAQSKQYDTMRRNRKVQETFSFSCDIRFVFFVFHLLILFLSLIYFLGSLHHSSSLLFVFLFFFHFFFFFHLSSINIFQRIWFV